ncbi:SDR family NAD(P)-dependent oxidoreductase [Fodinicurvata sp. EGI_FJ10296]|uniref:SDR family NAD(P)-dependent oxidoreductase n=1 Tax=Fodinicurvata sp. EGI_FJ10296 TaxID=3231908 RepID=UPI003452F289
MRFADKVVLVTGGTRGIGRSIVDRMAQEGARIAVTYRRDEDSARAAMADLEARGVTVDLIRSDLADPGEAATLPDRVVERWGRLDCLVNNAGGTHDGAFATMSPKDYEQVIETNLTGTLRLSLYAAKHLVETKGSMVMLSSLAGVFGKEGQGSYSASKGGLVGMTRYLARVFGPDGVRVNAVAPGFIETDMVRALEPAMYEHVLRGTAMKKMGQPEDVAGTVAFLGSDDAAYISGSVIRIDGGFHR